MLMQIYYLYTKLPWELDDVIVEMKACFEGSEFAIEGGNRPIWACETRFIAHKVLAIYWFIERYIDKQKLKRYILR